MGKVAISSDWHNKPFLKEKLKAEKWSMLEWLALLFYSKKSPVKRMIIFLGRNKEIKTLVLGGNLQGNMLNERGMTVEDDTIRMRNTLYFVTQMAEIKLELNAGKHELGYNSPWSSDKQAGISRAAIDNFLEIAERDTLFRAFSVEGKRFILIPYLFSEETHFCWVKKLQNDFLEQLLIELEQCNQKIMLIMYDFDSLKNKQLARLIRCAYDEGKIERVFCGCSHAKWGFVANQWLIRIFNNGFFMPFYAILSPFLMLAGAILQKDWMLFEKIRKFYVSKCSVLRLAKKLKPITIPAPDGLFGLGGGVLVYDTITNKVVRRKI